MEESQRNMTLTFQKYMTFTFTFNKCSLIYQISPIFLLSVQRTLSCLLSPVSCLLSPVSCLLSPVFCLPYSVSCPLSPVSRLPCCKCCRFNLLRYSGSSDFMEQICRLGQFIDLNALSGLSGLKANFF